MSDATKQTDHWCPGENCWPCAADRSRSPDHETETRTLRARVAELEERITRMTGDREQSRLNLEQYVTAHGQQAQRIAELEAKVDFCDSEMALYEARIAEQDAEVARLRESNQELQDSVDALIKPRILDMQIAAGRFEARIDGKGVAQIMAASYWKLLVDSNAPNFVQMTFEHAGNEMLVTLQRLDGKSPATLLAETKAQLDERTRERDEALAKVARLEAFASLVEAELSDAVARWDAPKGGMSLTEMGPFRAIVPSDKAVLRRWLERARAALGKPDAR